MATAATSKAADSALPPTQLLIRDKFGIQVRAGPLLTDETSYSLTSVPFVEPNAVLRIPPLYNPQGDACLLLHERKPAALHHADSGALLVELNVTDATKAYFSPLGTYVVTWSPPTKIGDTPIANMRVWSTSAGTLLACFVAKAYKADMLQWTTTEDFSFRQGGGEVYIYGAGKFNAEDTIAKVQHRGFTQFKIEAIANTTNVHVALFNPEHGGKPGMVSVYIFRTATSAVDGPVASRTIFGANEATMTWNKQGTSLLIHSHSDVDSSNASYYGATALYIIHPQSGLSSKVEQSKDGPVQDVKWSPTGDRFVAIAGNVPSAASLYNEKGEPVFHFGAAHRNTISWSPHGRFLCLAGFGNLAGEMDFYDTIRLKKLGSNTSHCATTFGWSPDSRAFLTASLAPRMNVDNNVKIFRYNGLGPVVQVDLERAYDAYWRPAPAEVYPNRPPSPRRGRTGSEGEAPPPPPVAPAPVAPAPYRPPGSTGSLSSFMSRDKEPQVPLGKVKKEAPQPAKYVPGPQKQRVIPGMAPPTAAAVKKPVPGAPPAALQPPKVAAAQKAPPAKTTAVTSAPVPPAAPMDPAAEKEKRVKALNKKLKQIDEIKAKAAAGQSIDSEQTKKLESEASLRAELDSLA